MKRLLSAVVMLALASGVAYANVPDPTACTVMPYDTFTNQRMVVIGDVPAPSALADVDIFVAATGGIALENRYVEIFFAGECDASMCYCDGLVLSGYTGTGGNAGLISFNLAASGCCEVTTAGRIVADGLPIRGYDIIVSPDYDGFSGSCGTDLSDFIAFGAAGWTGQETCYDTSGDGIVGLPDFIAFGSAFGTVQGCTEAP